LNLVIFYGSIRQEIQYLFVRKTILFGHEKAKDFEAYLLTIFIKFWTSFGEGIGGL
jgi:hypothetical protein